MPDRWIADLILVVHALIVLFNVGSLPLIWIGYFLGWKFVRNFYFRAVHVLLIGFVTAETVLGAICPLTIWEDALRQDSGQGARYEGGFMAHWVHRLIYYDVDPKVFITAYVVFFLLVAATLILVRPAWPEWWKRHSGPPPGNKRTPTNNSGDEP